MNVPILLVIFNRPDTTQKVFDVIRKVKPRQLFVSADGPRPHREDDAIKTKEARAIVDQVDWECEVKTLFRTENLGCRTAVSGGISWFFEAVEYGIIIEDDLVPDLSFFRFCETLLEKYKDDERVFQIGGANLMAERFTKVKSSYVFSKFIPISGWATWRRAWQKMDVNLSDIEKFKTKNTISDFVHLKMAQSYMIEKLEDTHYKRNSSWAYAWLYSVLNNGGYSIIPTKNLIHNIGFGDDATNTTTTTNEVWMRPAEEVIFPLKHPEEVTNDPIIDQHFFYTTQKTKMDLYVYHLVPESVRSMLRNFLGK